jgi:hypothetical protein
MGPNKLKDKKLNIVLYRAFNLSCRSDYVSEFSTGQDTKIIIKVLRKQEA